MSMYFIPKWYEDPNSLDPDKNEDLVQAVDAISQCVQIVRSLIAVNNRTFDSARFLSDFTSLQQILPPTTRLLMPLDWELDPIAAVHGVAQVGETTGGNHLSAARQWVVRYYMDVLAWTNDYARAMNDINAQMFTPDAFEWARERILAVSKKMVPVNWVEWRVHAEQEVRTAIAKRNEFRAKGIQPPVLRYGCSGPAPVVEVRTIEPPGNKQVTGGVKSKKPKRRGAPSTAARDAELLNSTVGSTNQGRPSRWRRKCSQAQCATSCVELRALDVQRNLSVIRAIFHSRSKSSRPAFSAICKRASVKLIATRIHSFFPV
jgi:hypothetical protein